MFAKMFFIAISIILIFKSVSSELVKCPDTETITGLNINEVTIKIKVLIDDLKQ
jgi:hypothetical protein